MRSIIIWLSLTLAIAPLVASRAVTLKHQQDCEKDLSWYHMWRACDSRDAAFSKNRISVHLDVEEKERKKNKIQEHEEALQFDEMRKIPIKDPYARGAHHNRTRITKRSGPDGFLKTDYGRYGQEPRRQFEEGAKNEQKAKEDAARKNPEAAKKAEDEIQKKKEQRVKIADEAKANAAAKKGKANVQKRSEEDLTPDEELKMRADERKAKEEAKKEAAWFDPKTLPIDSSKDYEEAQEEKQEEIQDAEISEEKEAEKIRKSIQGHLDIAIHEKEKIAQDEIDRQARENTAKKDAEDRKQVVILRFPPFGKHNHELFGDEEEWYGGGQAGWYGS